MKEVAGTRTNITDAYVPVGAKTFTVSSAKGFKAGDRIVVLRPGTERWIHDLKMDQIEEREGTVQWKPGTYDLHFERTITRVEGDKIFLDNPVVMAMEAQYGGGAIYVSILTAASTMWELKTCFVNRNLPTILRKTTAGMPFILTG